MSEEHETYKGKDILASTDKEVQLSIGGQGVDVSRDETSGRFVTVHLPYTSYDSLIDLAKQVIDNVPDFRSDQND